MAIFQEEYVVVVEASSAQQFAKDLIQVEKEGCFPMKGQAHFYNGGVHVAYYVKPSEMKDEEAGVDLIVANATASGQGLDVAPVGGAGPAVPHHLV